MVSVMLVKRKAKGPNDRIGAVYPGHHGPVYALQRHNMFGNELLGKGSVR